VKSFWKWFIGAVTTIVAALFIFRKSKKIKEPPPSNKVSEVMAEEINSDLKEELNTISVALEDGSPAERLAELGNVRSRR
jgi:hypothetical protein